MSHHLTENAISRCLIDDGVPQERQHLGECAACRAELAGLESSLAQFRGSIHRWSEREHYRSWCKELSIMNFDNRLKGMYGGHETAAGLSSVVLHVAAVALLLFVGTLQPVRKAMKEFVPIFAPDLKPLQPKPKPEQSKGGGGSPDRTAETQGQLPKVAPKSFVPPIRPQDDPKLAMNPTIVATDLPNISSPNFGNPLAGLGVPSAGNGKGFGIGTGNGPGFGPGSNGGFGGAVYKIGGGVSAPVPIFKPEPEYSEEARKAKWQGAVLLEIVVDENGVPQNIKVLRSLGLGLDQKAIEAVQKWRFKPGLKDGKAVPVSANIEVNFRLL